jgi:prenylcysteine oxidase / farnesylcysteine lyase
VTFEDPELARGFYYTSGIESFISTMETSALMGMNVAQLIIDDYLDVVEKEPEWSATKSPVHEGVEEL